MIIKMIKKIAVSAFIFLLFSTANAFSFELPLISKSKIRIIAEPGKTIFGEIVVENQTDTQTDLKLYLNDWKYLPAGDGTKDFFAPETTPLSCASWITFSPAQLSLPPFGKQKVNYSVKVPENASGGRYAALFFESLLGKLESSAAGLQAGMNIAIRVATLFYVEPKGRVNRSAVIKKLSFENLKSPESFALSLDLENAGNTDITAAGTFHVTDDEGMVLARDEFKNGYMFANEKAVITAITKAKVPRGVYNLVLTIDLGKALEEADLGRGPVITREAKIEFDASGNIVRIGELK